MQHLITVMKSLGIVLFFFICHHACFDAFTPGVSYFIANAGHSCGGSELPCLTVNDLESFCDMMDVFLHFSPGTHILSKSEPIIFERTNKVHITGYLHSTEVICVNGSGFMFEAVRDATVANISLTNCGTSAIPGMLPSALFFHAVRSTLLQDIHLYNSTSVGVYVSDACGEVRIRDTVVSGSAAANVVCEWRAVDVEIDFTVQNLELFHGGNLDSGEASFSGGMNLLFSDVANISGSIELDGVNFYKNSGHVGGNLNIEILHGDCIQSNNQSLSITLSNSWITQGKAVKGAGLSFINKPIDYSLNCLTCSSGTNFVSFEVSNTSITNNEASDKGGGMYILFGGHLDRCEVYLEDLKVFSNVVTSVLSHEQSRDLFAGGGVFVHLVGDYMFQPDSPSLTFSNIYFQGNSAHTGGAVYMLIETTAIHDSLFSLGIENGSQVLVNIEGLECNDNTAFTGACAAISVDDTSAVYNSPTFQVLITSSNFTGNTASTQGSGLLVSQSGGNFQFQFRNASFSNNNVLGWSSGSDTYLGVPSTLFLDSVTKVHLENCTLVNNTGSALGAYTSRIAFAGLLFFAKNKATSGSGMNLLSSHLEIFKSANVTFESNRGQVGGAIYAVNSMQSSCFYTITGDNHTDNHEVFHFADNVGTLGGNVLYEQTISNCTRLEPTLGTSRFLSVSDVVSQDTPLTLSDAYQVCTCQQNNNNNDNNSGYDCSSNSLSLSVVVGSPLALSLMIADENGLPTPGFITSRTYYDAAPIPYYPTNGTLCVEATFSSTISDHLVLVPQNYRHYSPATFRPLNLSLFLLPCPPGFYLSENSSECSCLPSLTTNPLVHCNPSEYTITRIAGFWIGLDLNSNFSVHGVCPFNYCKTGKVKLHYQEDTSLCVSGRSGILCGECEGNLSLTLGSDSCAECSDNYIALVLVIAVLGLLLVVLITALNITITEGAINGIIFSLAFLHLNRDAFFPQYSNGNIFVILISWVNLDFGFNMCFYDGLTPYAKTWLQYIFPLYLYIIDIVIQIISYKSSRFARIMGARNRLKIMSTIFLLGYMKMLRAAILTISSTELRSWYNYEDTKTVWLYDGSMQYCSGRHIPLFIVAVLFLAFLSIPYTAYFLLFQILHRYARLPCQPKRDGLVDAHVGAFKDKCRFWLGLLLLTYTVLVVLYYFTGGDKDINLTALVVTCPALLLLKIWCKGVYKNKIVDYMESTLLFNVVVVSAVTLQLTGSSSLSVSTALYVMFTVIFFIVFITMVYHLYMVCSGDSTACGSCSWCACLSRSKQDRWNEEQDKVQDDISLNSFETEYEDAHHLIPMMDTEEGSTTNSRYGRHLFPSNWYPTVYPVPVFREDPDLLKTDEATRTTHSSNSSENSPVREVVQIRSSLLVVDKIEDDIDANLVPSSSDTLRSRRLSADGTYIIEDHHTEQGVANVTSETTSATDSKEKEQPRPDTATEVQNECSAECSAAVDVNKVAPKANVKAVIEKVSTPVLARHQVATPELRLRRNSQTARHSFKKNSCRRLCRRPQPGTLCYKWNPSLCLQTKIRRFKINRDGGDCSINTHDILLSIPPSAIKEEDVLMLDFEVGVVLDGPFVFPPHIRPISPVIWVCIRNNASLCKPINITLPHFLNNIDSNDAKRLGLRFMKAYHHPRVYEDGKKRFIFDNIGNDTTTTFTSQVGKLETRHLCFVCIAAPESRSLYEHASYCLVRVDPAVWNPSIKKQEIFFIVTYNMKTCCSVSMHSYMYAGVNENGARTQLSG